MSKAIFSPIIAGTMTWGTWGKNCTTQQMSELIHCCVENNITSFDHADIYGNYTTEAAFGKAFAESNINRQSLQFISKCGIQMQNAERENLVKHYNYSTQYIVWSVEQSLKNLQTDYLDLLLLHRPSPLMQADEIAEAIHQLKASGKIIDFGVSNFTPTQTDLLKSKENINYNQIEFSITQHEAMFNGSLDYMQTNNIIPMAWSPLGTVFKNDSEQTRCIKNTATAFSAKYNAPVEVILIAWILKHPANILPVFGTTNKCRIANLIKAATVNMDLQDWFTLLESTIGKPIP